MTPVARSLAAASLLCVALPRLSDAQSSPAFTGRYRFTLTASSNPLCSKFVPLGPLSVILDVSEAAIGSRSEVSGRGAAASAIPDNGRFVFLRSGAGVHGPFGAHTEELGLDTDGRYRLWMRIMADGTITTGTGGRARATGTAFGEIEASLASDPTGNPVANCETVTSTHQWTLEPI